MTFAIAVQAPLATDTLDVGKPTQLRTNRKGELLTAGAGANTDGSTAIAGENGTAKASASNPVPVQAVSLTPLGYQQIVSATLASATALTVPTGAQYAIIQNNGTTAVRYRDDGTDPTASIGQRLPNDKELFYEGNLAALKFIYVTTGAILDIAYYS